MALASKYRLTGKQLARVFKQGKTVKNSFFFIRFISNDLGFARVAVIVPVKVLRKATARNYLKRFVIETIRTKHFLENSYDVIITATSNIVGKQPEEIKRGLEQTTNIIFVQK